MVCPDHEARVPVQSYEALPRSVQKQSTQTQSGAPGGLKSVSKHCSMPQLPTPGQDCIKCDVTLPVRVPV